MCCELEAVQPGLQVMAVSSPEQFLLTLTSLTPSILCACTAPAELLQLLYMLVEVPLLPVLVMLLQQLAAARYELVWLNGVEQNMSQVCAALFVVNFIVIVLHFCDSSGLSVALRYDVSVQQTFERVPTQGLSGCSGGLER
jgi:hypothetical protein